jgi:hypothetical protein
VGGNKCWISILFCQIPLKHAHIHKHSTPPLLRSKPAKLRIKFYVGHPWLTPVILATWKAEIGKIMV